jgi:hypothetical protein
MPYYHPLKKLNKVEQLRTVIAKADIDRCYT